MRRQNRTKQRHNKERIKKMAKKNANDCKNGRIDPPKTVTDAGKGILPAGTPKQKNPYGEPLDPTVPNRARTEMKSGASSKKVP